MTTHRIHETARSEAAFRTRPGNRFPAASIRPCARSAAWAARRPFIARGEGSHIFDVDGNDYIDYVGSWGPLLLGHRHPAIIEALREALETGTSFGAPTEREVELAELISRAVPSMEMVRLVNSGTEATMSALRLARGFTGRDLIVKFEGCYHGHVDSLLVKAGSGMATLGIADTAGVPKAFADTTIALPFNSIAAVESAFARARRRDRRRDRRAGGRATWAACRPRPDSWKLCANHRALRRAADFRRSDDRFPRGAGRRAAAFTASGPT